MTTVPQQHAPDAQSRDRPSGVSLDVLEVKTAAIVAADQGQFTALAAAFGNVDRDGDVIVPGAFAKSLAAWREFARPIPVLWAHGQQPDDIIGAIAPDAMVETDAGLEITGTLDLEGGTKARRAWRLVKAGNIALSFGFVPMDRFKRSDGVQELREVDLYEVSLTAAPANPATRVTAWKQARADDDDHDHEHERQHEPALSPHELMRARLLAEGIIEDETYSAAREQMLQLLRSSNGHGADDKALTRAALQAECQRLGVPAAAKSAEPVRVSSFEC